MTRKVLVIISSGICDRAEDHKLSSSSRISNEFISQWIVGVVGDDDESEDDICFGSVSASAARQNKCLPVSFRPYS